MNAAMMLVLIAGGAATGQRDAPIFKAPLIEVRTDQRDDKAYSYLMYNRVYMGRQYHKSNTIPDLNRLPTTYFHDKSPIGIILKDPKWFPEKNAPPVAVLGMDIGTLAAYAKKGQTFHFTERVPTFVKLSVPDKGEKRYFTFIADAKERGADVKIFEGEPRAMLEKHGKDNFYKVIVVESYKLPVIEIHKELLTKEGLQLLMSKVREDGIVAIHTSNRYYKMAPIIGSAAKELKFACIVGKDMGEYYRDPKNDHRYSSEWVMVARDEKYLAHLKPLATKEVEWLAPEPINKKFIWTDKGSQSFRGLYFSDPDIDKWQDSVSDVVDLLHNGLGVSYSTIGKIILPVQNGIRAWSKDSADRLNRDIPETKKSTPKIEKN